MRGAAAVLLAFCLPAAAVANGLTFEFWPASDPGRSTYCALRLADGMVTAVEVRGMGLPPQRPMRWPVRPDEITALTAALQALVAEELPSVQVNGFRLPPPPFVTVTWITQVEGRMMSGLYVQTGMTLPPVLANVLTLLTPGGACAMLLELG